jgi:hypothetical protein
VPVLLEEDDPELDGLAHESLQVSPGTAPMSFEAALHLVTAAAGEDSGPGRFTSAIQRQAARPVRRREPTGVCGPSSTP